MKLLLFSIACVFFTGCAKFKGTNQSVWSEGMWIIPTLTILGSIFFGYRAYLRSKSNSTQQTQQGIVDNTGNVPIWKSWYFFASVTLLVATIAIIIYQNGQK